LITSFDEGGGGGGPPLPLQRSSTTFAEVVAMATVPAEPSNRLHAEPLSAASDARADPAGP
jgi:hypothetical protein